jgi:transglutaminase-like putative cysteine protease
MHLRPYQSVNGTPFTATRDDVIRAHGQPRSESRNTVGLTALDYGNVVYRFQDSGRLEEVTARAEVLHLGTVAVPFRDLAAFVQSSDNKVFYRAGFLVSPLYGIAFVPGEPSWVTALARHCMGEWDALRVS